jgi:hypothetical protein
MEELLRRYGIGLVCACPQILFGYESRLLSVGRDDGIERSLGLYHGTPYETPWRGPVNRGSRETVLSRLNTAYRILDEIYAPARRCARVAGGYGPAPGVTEP